MTQTPKPESSPPHEKSTLKAVNDDESLDTGLDENDAEYPPAYDGGEPGLGERITAILNGEEVVVFHEGTSQAGPGGGVSKCGLAAMNCARILFGREGVGLRNQFLLEDLMSRETVEHIVSICDKWNTESQTKVEDIQESAIFKHTLLLVSNDVGKPNHQELEHLLHNFAESPLSAGRSAVAIITRSPEVVACLKIHTTAVPIFAIFDSCSRPWHPDGAAFTFCTSPSQTALALEKLLAFDTRPETNVEAQSQSLSDFSFYTFVKNDEAVNLHFVALEASLAALASRAELRTTKEQVDSLTAEGKRLEVRAQREERLHEEQRQTNMARINGLVASKKRMQKDLNLRTGSAKEEEMVRSTMIDSLQSEQTRLLGELEKMKKRRKEEKKLHVERTKRLERDITELEREKAAGGGRARRDRRGTANEEQVLALEREAERIRKNVMRLTEENKQLEMRRGEAESRAPKYRNTGKFGIGGEGRRETSGGYQRNSNSSYPSARQTPKNGSANLEPNSTTAAGEWKPPPLFGSPKRQSLFLDNPGNRREVDRAWDRFEKAAPGPSEKVGFRNGGSKLANQVQRAEVDDRSRELGQSGANAGGQGRVEIGSDSEDLEEKRTKLDDYLLAAKLQNEWDKEDEEMRKAMLSPEKKTVDKGKGKLTSAPSLKKREQPDARFGNGVGVQRQPERNQVEQQPLNAEEPPWGVDMSHLRFKKPESGTPRADPLTLTPSKSTAPLSDNAPSSSGPTNEHTALQLAWEMQQQFEEEDRLLREERSALAGTAQRSFECGICMEVLPEDDVARIEGCEHVFCRECIRGYLVSKLAEHRYPIMCPLCTAGPNKEKPSTLTDAFLQEVGVPEENYATFVELEMLAHSIISQCRKCGRSAFVDREQYQEMAELNCPLPGCDYTWCKNCSREIAPGVKHSCDGTLELEGLMKEQGWKHCPGCKTPIQKVMGCNHMTCSTPGCNTQFCYTCGEKAIKYQHKCPLF